MVLHAQRAARLEHVEEGLEHRRVGAPAGEVVHVAEGVHGIGGTGRAEARRVAVEAAHLHRVVAGRVGGELVGVGLVVLLEVRGGLLAAGRGRIDDRGDQLAIALEQRRQHFGEPAGARGDLDHGHAGADAEELQGFLRVPVLVARLVGVAALRTCQHGVELLGEGLFGALGRCHRFGRRGGGSRLGGRRRRLAAGGQRERQGRGKGELVHGLALQGC